MIAAPADWMWRTAQSGDQWTPKRGKLGKEVMCHTALGRSFQMECGLVTIDQHHTADKSVMLKLEDGTRKVIKWASLKKHWKPLTERPLPPKASPVEQ